MKCIEEVTASRFDLKWSLLLCLCLVCKFLHLCLLGFVPSVLYISSRDLMFLLVVPHVNFPISVSPPCTSLGDFCTLCVVFFISREWLSVIICFVPYGM